MDWSGLTGMSGKAGPFALSVERRLQNAVAALFVALISMSAVSRHSPGHEAVQEGGILHIAHFNQIPNDQTEK